MPAEHPPAGEALHPGQRHVLLVVELLVDLAAQHPHVVGEDRDPQGHPGHDHPPEVLAPAARARPGPGDGGQQVQHRGEQDDHQQPEHERRDGAAQQREPGDQPVAPPPAHRDDRDQQGQQERDELRADQQLGRGAERREQGVRRPARAW